MSYSVILTSQRLAILIQIICVDSVYMTRDFGINKFPGSDSEVLSVRSHAASLSLYNRFNFDENKANTFKSRARLAFRMT